ncbi:nucleotidyltransferase family protein [Celeribacter sp. SCSIO 80788]|uniref:nucleotidyltransferase family protein n=1 Tax=Celeribacter sp. SCSIO 80788 TaxID=3117013 RepID=UPI003DA5C2C4
MSTILCRYPDNLYLRFVDLNIWVPFIGVIERAVALRFERLCVAADIQNLEGFEGREMCQKKPSLAFEQCRHVIRQLVAQYRASNPRVYGSVLRREDTEDSDLDILVDPMPETTLFDLGGLQEALAEALSVKVDVKTPRDLPDRIRDRVLSEAVPV